MKSFIWVTVISLLSFLVVFSAAGCSTASSVSPEEYAGLTQELADCKTQASALQEKLAGASADEQKYELLAGQLDTKEKELQSLKSEYDELDAKYTQLLAQSSDKDVTEQMQSLQADYDELDARYNSLKDEYDAIAGGAETLNEAAIEQAIFALVNAERKSRGLEELPLGVNIAKIAKSNSRDMEEHGDYLYASYSGIWQEIYITARNTSAQQIAEAALLIWKNNTYKFDYNILNRSSKYGAVGVIKSGEVYYITFVASTFK